MEKTTGQPDFIRCTRFQFLFSISSDIASPQLFSAPNIQIAAFRWYSQMTAVGPSYALLQYTFTQEDLLVEALLALCLNRWIDLHGF